MFRKLSGIVLVFALSPAFAEDLSYNYIEIGYQQVDFDTDLVGIDVDGDGFGIRGAFELGENWFVPVSYGTLDLDFGVELDRLSAGLGYHTPLSNGADFIATLSYLRAEASVGGFGSVDEDGYVASAGVRGLIGDRVELTGSIGYSDLGNGADGTVVNAGAQYSLTESFALGFDIELDEDVTLYALVARLYFGN